MPAASRPKPFLLVDDILICPWRPRSELLAWQAEQLEVVRHWLSHAAAVSRLPRVAWVEADAIHALPIVDRSWLARWARDGMAVAAWVSDALKSEEIAR